MTKPQPTAIVPHSAPKAILPQTTPAVTSLEQLIPLLRYYYHEQLQNVSDDLIREAIGMAFYNMGLSPEIRAVMHCVNSY